MDTHPQAFDDTSQGGAFVPIEGTATRGGPPITRVDSCAPFWLVWSRERYTILDGKVIPAFKKLHCIPGVNGVGQVIDRITGAVTAVKTSIARADVQDRGEIIIPFDAVPPSLWHLHNNGGKSYLWHPDGRPDVSLEIWTKVYPGSRNMDPDVPVYLEWIEWLETTGVIPRPPAHVLRKMLAQRETERDALAKQAVVNATLRPAVEKASADIAVIEARLADRHRIAPDPAEGAAAPAAGESFVPPADDAPAPTSKGKVR